MFDSLTLILSTARLLVSSGWQMIKMLARFYALVIPATVRVAITRPKRRKGALDRYLVECGDWTLQARIRVSGRSLFLSSLSLTKRTGGQRSSSTATTSVETAPPPPDASLHLEELGRAFQP